MNDRIYNVRIQRVGAGRGVEGLAKMIGNRWNSFLAYVRGLCLELHKAVMGSQ